MSPTVLSVLWSGWGCLGEVGHAVYGYCNGCALVCVGGGESRCMVGVFGMSVAGDGCRC